MSIKDYAEEMEFFYNQAFSRFISDNQVNEGAVKRLSMYSNSLKSH